ncbi:MAG: hypothetical protein ABI689_08120 [Thermoanaerobaculia bacterium]
MRNGFHDWKRTTSRPSLFAYPVRHAGTIYRIAVRILPERSAAWRRVTVYAHVHPRIPQARARCRDRPPAQIVPLHELAAAIRPGEIDIAVNIHSFSECPLPAIDAWLAFLAANRVEQLMIVPNAVSAGGRNGITMLTNAGEDFSALVRRHGYALSASEPKYPDPVVQEYGVSPAAHLLFRLEA